MTDDPNTAEPAKPRRFRFSLRLLLLLTVLLSVLASWVGWLNYGESIRESHRKYLAPSDFKPPISHPGPTPPPPGIARH